jgi:hypothetical protein
MAASVQSMTSVHVPFQTLLTERWTTLQLITLSPGRIGDIVRAALVLVHFEHGKLT